MSKFFIHRPIFAIVISIIIVIVGVLAAFQLRVAQYPQISQYLNEYNQEKETYDKAKTTAVESAKAELKTAKDYETKVKTAYQEAENEEDTANFSPIMYNKETAAQDRKSVV